MPVKNGATHSNTDMKIKVIAPFPVDGRDKNDMLDLPEGSRVRDIYKGAPLHLGRVLPVFVNGQQVKKSHVLKEGDVVIFLAPISGG